MHLFFPELEPPIINIMYRWSGICGQFVLGYFLLSLVISLKLMIFVFYEIATFTSLFLYTSSWLIQYAYVSIEPIDCNLLSSLAVNAILLTSSVNTICFSLLSLCRYFNINFLFIMSSLWFSLRLYTSNLFFSM